MDEYSVDPVIADNMCDSQFYDQQTATDTANSDANSAIGAQNWVKSELRLVYPDTIGTEIKMFP